MKDKELNLLLRDQADGFGVCAKFREVWRDDFSRQELIDFYKRGIEFCIDCDWPSDDFITKHFDDELLKNNNIFIGNFGEVIKGNGVYICNGKSTGTLRFAGMDVATVYIRGNSTVCVIAEDISKVFIDVLDEADVSVTQRGHAAVYVYQKSKKSRIETEGKVMIRRKG